MSFKMFISYTSKDREKIQPFLDMLKAIHGLAYYFFEETKEIAKEVKEDVIANLHGSDSFLVFYSKNSLQANFVQHEIGGAITLRKPVVIANLDGSKPDGMLQGINYLDFYNETLFKQEIDKLINWIKAKIREQQETAIVKPQQAEEFDWAGFLIVAGILAGSFYLLSKVKK